MATVNKGLGRGLNAFFDNVEDVQNNVDAFDNDSGKILGKVVELDMNDVEPMPGQPRKKFDQEKMDELAESIREHGVIQPILVVKDGDIYRIVAGERRWRASKMLGLEKIPAIVKEYTVEKKKQIALIENIQREDLNAIEVANALKELMDMEKYTVNEVSKITAKNSSTINNLLRLLKLPSSIQDMVMDGRLVEGQARALLAVEDSREQIKLAKKIVENKLTVRQVEKMIYADSADKYKVKKRGVRTKDAIQMAIEEKLTEYFGMKVKLETNKMSPAVVIEYYNDDGLANLLEKLNIEI